MKCNKCNTDNPQEAKYCRYCGEKIQSNGSTTKVSSQKQTSKKENSKGDDTTTFEAIGGVVGMFGGVFFCLGVLEVNNNTFEIICAIFGGAIGFALFSWIQKIIRGY